MKFFLYYPFGILDCKNLKEKIYLHFLEHLFADRLIKSLGLDLESIRAGVVFDHIGFNLDIELKKVDLVINFFKNFDINKNINSKDFEIQKNRMIEEEELFLLDPIKNSTSYIMNTILNNKLFDYERKNTIKILRKVSFKEIVNFYKNFYDFEKFLVISLYKDVKLIKKSSLEISRNIEINPLPKKMKRIDGIPKSFVYLIYIEPTLSNIFFARILTKKIEKLIKKVIILKKSMVYSYFFKPIFNLSSRLFYLFLIPSTEPNKVMKEFLSLKKLISLNDKYVQEEKEKFLNQEINEILKISRPAIIWSALKNKEIFKIKDIKNTIKNIKSGNISNLDFKESLTVII